MSAALHMSQIVQISGELDMTARLTAHYTCAWPFWSANLELVCQFLGDELKGRPRSVPHPKWL